MIERARRLAEHPAVRVKRGPAADPALPGEPWDLGALYATTDGIELGDGTRILARSEIAAATEWLKGERSLEWGAELWVIGERDDLVIVRDLDVSHTRAGGGVLEAPTDGLSALSRAALDVIGYLEERVGTVCEHAPERAAREAVAHRDAEGIAHALAREFYPGAERDRAHAALSLGAIRAGAGDAEGAMAAFAQAVAARVRAAPRGAGTSVASAAWKMCAVAAEKAGAAGVAAACLKHASPEP